MFDEFRKRRANQDIIDISDYWYYLYMFSSGGVAIFIVCLVAPHLPPFIGFFNVIAAQLLIFLTLGFWLFEWVLNTPEILKRVLPKLAKATGVALLILFIPYNWLLAIFGAGLIYARIQRWRANKRAAHSSAP